MFIILCINIILISLGLYLAATGLTNPILNFINLLKSSPVSFQYLSSELLRIQVKRGNHVLLARIPLKENPHNLH